MSVCVYIYTHRSLKNSISDVSEVNYLVWYMGPYIYIYIYNWSHVWSECLHFSFKSSGEDNLEGRKCKSTCKILKYNHSLAYSKMHQEHHPGTSWLTRQDLLFRNCIWTSVWVTSMQTVMRGKSWSRIGLFISHCWPFVAGSYFVLLVVMGIVDV